MKQRWVRVGEPDMVICNFEGNISNADLYMTF
jgi:hypothetical protein